ncbi:hypothetical protein FT663_04441 [Candidozyma haemuli var. vulneris]|uniref:RAD50-interacting protein 1 n=1 Tax=Candidozyma haemuli TaxID=45357 RepID=A0A2V1ASL4_9ASCO|nr:hypothetical protein CXQ85_004292 [[Candida] haemuloni]KAF3987447.1 hypothetical protein FT663_04441 [[Candida] haemuloni var. vulneris]KAF3991753.1 hypothetical protein FT662_01507 [[Candida] haemuloni var. vulneris]PVH20785.1 hypothetical protein CXQ85_004292 [[Candida] haemuloni]
MDYINAHFVSLGDLDDVDDHITRLNDRLAQIQNIIKEKTSGVPDSVPESTSRLLEQLEASDPTQLRELVSEHGTEGVKERLQKLWDEKSSIETSQEALVSGAELEKSLDNASALGLDDLKVYADRVAEIDQFDIKELLEAKLLQVILQRKETLVPKLDGLLSEIKWLSPKEQVSVPSSTMKEITGTLAELVDLQAISDTPHYPDVWWALEILVKPFVVRFNYHFSQASETNRMSRPEWALNYVEKFFADYIPSIELVLGDTFLKHGRIGVFEVITAALVPVREKISGMTQSLNSHIEKANEEDDLVALEKYGRVLSHLIFEMASFDQRLRNNYKYNPHVESFESAPERKWLGLTGDTFMGSSSKDSPVVTNWLNLELQLAKKRFDSDIIGAADAFSIDYEFDASSANPHNVLKPSYSAYALVKLFDNLTTHFKTLSIVKYQLKYVSNIQLTFLDEYLKALENTFKAFNESLSSKLIANFLPGTTKPDTTTTTPVVVNNGLKGLEMLTGIYCSLKFVIQHMEQWSGELLFVQLWNFYKTIATNKVKDDSIFSSSLDEYNAMLKRVFSKYEEFFKKEIRAALKQFVNSGVWVIDDESHKNQPSPQLSNFITIVPAYMSFLRRALPEADYFLVTSKVCDSFARIFQEYVVTNNQFNANGVEQLKTDFDCLVSHLSGPLLLNSEHPLFTNLSNRNYKKVLQSLEMLSTLDVSTAKTLRGNAVDPSHIRERFENRLDCLTDREINDLLFRIV